VEATERTVSLLIFSSAIVTFIPKAAFFMDYQKRLQETADVLPSFISIEYHP
jgi:branched-subunit amino acid transport protein